MTTYNKYPRGSEWRKWDLHVHAPSKYTCAKMDEYFGSNPSEKFIRFIEELKELNDLAAVGITDYFSLDGYKEVVNYQNSLSHIPLILPNVELRLIPMTNDAKKINVHMIFNPENITVDEFERFLYKFEFGVNEKYTCKEEDLIRLGKSLDSHLSEEAAFKRGLNEFYISFNDFHEKYNAQSNRFKENTIVIVSNNSRDGVSGIQNMSATRNNIYMIADMIFSGNPSDRVYFLGLGIDSESAVKDKCGALKPCIHGSDYHGGNNGRKLAVPDLNKYCWIKADPTFEGLRQVIYEPKDRICIQELEPDTKRPYQVIESIRFIDSNFMTEEIPLNSNLTAIIGGKSTGKSVLLRNIAKAIDNKLVEDKLTEVNIPQYKQTVIDFSVKWKNGEESTVQTNIPSKKVIYIPQSYLNRLSGDIEKRETVIKLIEDIIKQNSQISAVFDKIEQSRREISKEVALEIESMYSCYQDIQEQEYAIKELGDADTVQTELNKLEQEITEYKKKEGMTDQEIADYQELLDENVALTDQKQVIETDMQNLDMLIQDGICFADIDIFSFSDKTGQKIQVEFEAVKQEAAKAFTIRLTALKTILE
ncbi:MAG: hypothetical protein LBJ25_03225, partial [Candidatus Margulisbacteria bacterium]|nr:hypothetical protein [Candidatus Margulisiibacteriota bacterium]